MAAPVRKLSRDAHRRRIHVRMRKKISGTPERPRLCVHRTTRHICAQVIDDQAGRTIVSASSLDKDVRARSREAATSLLPKWSAKSLPSAPVRRAWRQVVFDRGGYQYHGRVQALAESAREAGLKF